MLTPPEMVQQAIERFTRDVSAKFRAAAPGAPEDQLRAPFENLLAEIGVALDLRVIAKGESQLEGRLGRPDYAVLAADLLAGYVELKEPGKGARPERYRGHDRRQGTRFEAIPNLLYTDGQEWGLYRSGVRASEVIRTTRDIQLLGARPNATAGEELLGLFRDFLSWQPLLPSNAEGLAEVVAPICRIMRDDVADALSDPDSRLVRLAADWRQLLFPEADDERFADAYAQTVTFALLLARSEGANTLELRSAIHGLAAAHSLLSRALEVLTDPQAASEIPASLALLQRITAAIEPSVFSRARRPDPWLYFYETFLAAYDPDLRRDAGAYYTPVEVVHAQVALVDQTLRARLDLGAGFADPRVITLDPAVGTGTYLLGVIEHALKEVTERHGAGAVPGVSTELAHNLFGFEIMVGPYAVSELRISRAIADRGGRLRDTGPGVYLTDTLESPFARPPRLPLYLQPMAQQHELALRVKEEAPVLVCIGNPPYDRHAAVDVEDPASRARSGGWVRWGAEGEAAAPILEAFTRPVIEAGQGGDLKNLYNLYVYFWRWALWKVFEHTTARGPGIVSFISAASYLYGEAFGGMREHMRRLCDEIWIIDLGGEGRGTRRSENVFAIQTPVAIAVAARYGETSLDRPASVLYARIEGSREEKLEILDKISDFSSLEWSECPSGWAAAFRPAGLGVYFNWPKLTDIFPWQHSGSQLKRTWPIASEREVLENRWRALVRSSLAERASLFYETRDRTIERTYRPLLTDQRDQPSISSLIGDADVPQIMRYSYRSFDRVWVIADSRVGDFMRPDLWRIARNPQVFMTTLLNHPLGQGPAVTAAAHVPDLHHFRGSFGAKEAIPLYRDPIGRMTNVAPGVIDGLSRRFERAVSGEEIFAYCYAIAGQPIFTERFQEELDTRELRIPVTSEPELFAEVVRFGSRLLWLHTFGERFGDGNQLPQGRARSINPVSALEADYPRRAEYDARTETLRVGTGTFAPVSEAVWEFEVSGYKVLQSWLAYRSAEGAGRQTSELDEIRQKSWTAQQTRELLELLWVLEDTIGGYPEQEVLFQRILDSVLMTSDDFGRVPDALRHAPTERPLLDAQE